MRSPLRLLAALLLASLAAQACGLKVSLPEQRGAVSSSDETLVDGEEGTGTQFLGEAAERPAASTPGAGTQGSATPAAGSPTPTPAGRVLPPFTDETVGVTSSELTICTHAPITGAAPIQRDPKQLNVYWDWLNDRGGVNGRRVASIVEDDRFTPDGAISVANRCKDRAFLIAGPAGVDQISAVADWAQQNQVPYVHGPASVGTIGSNPYQFFLAPDYEYQHRLLADYVVKVLGARKVAQVRVDSPHFAQGAAAFRQRLAQHGVSLMADVTVAQGQTSFSGLAGQLQGAEVVNNFTNPVTWINMLGQLQFLEPRPTWVAVSPVAGQNLLVQAFGALVPEGGIQVFYHAPVFPSAQTRTFEAAFDKYWGQGEPDDIDWLSWVLNHQLAQLLQAAGRDLTRSKLVATIEDTIQTAQQAAPACPLDFPRDPEHRRGAWSVNVFRSQPGKWTQAATCAERF